MTAASAALNTHCGKQKRRKNIKMAKMYRNVCHKVKANDGIIKSSQILGQFMMKAGANI
jgi:hypothetical protein